MIHVDYVKYLGLCIDKYLSWNSHVLQLNKKLSRANGILSKLHYYAPIETCLQVNYSLIYSHLIYGSNVWGLTSAENLCNWIPAEELFKNNFSDFRSHTNRLFFTKIS